VHARRRHVVATPRVLPPPAFRGPDPVPVWVDVPLPSQDPEDALANVSEALAGECSVADEVGYGRGGR